MRDTPKGLSEVGWKGVKRSSSCQLPGLPRLPPAQPEVQGGVPLPGLHLLRVGAQHRRHVPPVPGEHNLPQRAAAGEEVVQIPVQEGLHPPLAPAGVHLLPEGVQLLLGLFLPADGAHPAAQPHQLPHGGLHHGHALPDGPVQLHRAAAQGGVPVQHAEGVPLPPAHLHHGGRRLPVPLLPPSHVVPLPFLKFQHSRRSTQPAKKPPLPSLPAIVEAK